MLINFFYGFAAGKTPWVTVRNLASSNIRVECRFSFGVLVSAASRYPPIIIVKILESMYYMRNFSKEIGIYRPVYIYVYKLFEKNIFLFYNINRSHTGRVTGLTKIVKGLNV